MSNWNGLVLTEKGQLLQAKVEAGETLVLTKMKIGSGVLGEGKALEKLTDLVIPRQNIDIAERSFTEEGYCRISAVITNNELEEGYYVRELGVFAQDPTEGEILYAITTDSAPDYLPAGGGSAVISQEFSVYVAVGNAENVSVNINMDSLATVGFVKNAIVEHNSDAAAHPIDLKVFDNVADMVACSALIDGMKCHTAGYYSVNDGGAAYYRISDAEPAGYSEKLVDGKFAELILGDTVNAKQVGAKGDGSTDDTEALQKAFNCGYLQKANIYIPSGRYIVSKPLLVYGAREGVYHSSLIYGDGRTNTTIVKNTADVLGNNASYDANAVMILVTGDNIFDNKNYEVCSNVRLNGFKLDGSNLSDYGLYMPMKTSGSLFENLRIQNVIEAGIYCAKNHYLSNYNQVSVYFVTNGYGIYLFTPGSSSNTQEARTSLHFNNCYVCQCRVGYKISGIYLEMSNCCGDGMTETVFDLEKFRGTLNSPGSESRKATTTFRFFTSTVVVNGAYTFGNFENADAQHIYCNSGSIVTFNGGRIALPGASADAGKDVPGRLYLVGNNSILTFNNVRLGAKYTANDSISTYNSVVKWNNETGNTNLRYGLNIAYLGADTATTDGYIDANASNHRVRGNAIYMGMGTNLTKTAAGKSMTVNRYTMKGDIVLSQEPKKLGAIGWIQTAEPTNKSNGNEATFEDGEYLKIPIILSGTTAERPTVSLEVGQQYFDADLGQPIWYKGDKKWVDSSGKVV